MFLEQEGTERKRNGTKEERKKCFLGNYMLLRIEREKKYHFLVLEQETFEGVEMFPHELYTFANIERKRERKYHFSSRCSPDKKLLKKRKQNERKERMFSRELYAPANRKREKLPFFPE